MAAGRTDEQTTQTTESTVRRAKANRNSAEQPRARTVNIASLLRSCASTDLFVAVCLTTRRRAMPGEHRRSDVAVITRLDEMHERRHSDEISRIVFRENVWRDVLLVREEHVEPIAVEQAMERTQIVADARVFAPLAHQRANEIDFADVTRQGHRRTNQRMRWGAIGCSRVGRQREQLQTFCRRRA